MFQPLIDQARAMINRLYAATEHGRDMIPDTVKIRSSEFEAWDITVQGVIQLLFGAQSTALARWHALSQRRSSLIGEAMRKDIKRGEYYGLIDYFHFAIGALLEFEVAYQMAVPTSATAPIIASVSTPIMAPEATPEPEHIAEPQPEPAQEPDPGPSVTVRSPTLRVDDEHWEVIVTMRDETYRWLDHMVATHHGSPANDGVGQLVASIVERVVANARRSTRQ